MRMGLSSKRMQRLLCLSVFAVVIAGAVACTVVPPNVSPNATLQYAMRTEIDPHADALWDSNGSTVTAAGTQEIRPKTDAEWDALRAHALHLRNAYDILSQPHLQVAIPGADTEGTGTAGVRTAADIQAAIAENRPVFLHYAEELRRGAALALEAIGHKDPDALFVAGGVFYEACAGCHSAFWAAPDERRPRLPAQINLQPSKP